MTEYSPDEVLDQRDRGVLAELARVVATVDPVPEGLAERALFALTLAGLHEEMVELTRLASPELAVRGEETQAGETVRAKTITFTAEACTVMITLSPSVAGAPGPSGRAAWRVDGWVAPSARYVVELVRPGVTLSVESDDDGCFVLDDVPSGPAGLVLRRADGTGPTVATPVIEL